MHQLVDRAAWVVSVLMATTIACSGTPPLECFGNGTAGTGRESCTTDGSRGTGGNGGAGCALLDDIHTDQLPPISFDRYHSQVEMESYFASVAASFPTIASYRVLGQSVEGRDLFYLVINATCQEKPPAFLGIGAHHGDEKSTSESVLATADYLLRQAGSSTEIKTLLGRYSVYLLPIMNPDGFAANTRGNANGVDVNRDYSFPARDDANSFTQPETLLVKSLQDSVQFHSAITYHSGTLEVIWPWCYTGDAPADETRFVFASKNAADAMSFSVYQQSYDDYPTQGEYIDYAYWKHRTLAATFEISTAKTPPVASLASTVSNTCSGTLAWLQAVSSNDTGPTEPPVMLSTRRRFPLQAPVGESGKLE
jgi:hypothetical protein